MTQREGQEKVIKKIKITASMMLYALSTICINLLFGDFGV
jgi:hypothetical protein